MAILEFEFKGIDQNFRSSAANVLKDIDKIKSAFSGIGGGSVDVSGLKKGMDEVRASIKLAESDNKMFLATKLADTRQAGIEELNAIRSTETKKQQAYRTTGEAWKAQREQEKNIGVGLDNSFKETRNSIAKLNEEQKRYNATQRETRDALKNTVYPTDSIVGMRTRLNELRTVYDRLSESQRNSGRVQSNLVGEINRLNTAVSRAEQSTGRFQRNVGNYQQAQSGANGVAMEFNRIIQDAPYGMMGIGNNIQQLSANWQHYTTQVRAAATANGTTVTSMSLVKGAMASMMSTGNLITLGVAAITSAWTFYTMQQQKANKATKDNRSEMDKLKDSMSNYNQVLAENEAKGQNEITRLNRLMSVYKDVNQSQRTRKGAYEDMISLYETYFGKLSKEERKTFDLAKAYDKLSVSILKTAKARAFDDLIQQNEKDIILLEKSLIDSGNKIIGATNKVGEQYRKNRVKSSEDASKQGVNPRNIYEIKQAEDALNKSAEEGNKIATRKNTLLRENKGYEKEILALGLEGAKITDSTGDAGKEREKATANTTKNIKDQRDYLLEIQQILQNSQGRVDTGGEILDWDKELIKVHNYYDSQTIALDKMLVSSQRAYKDDSAKRLQIEQAVSSTRITLHNNMINELSKIDNKYFTDGMAKIAELNAKYGESMDLDTRSSALKKVVDEFSKLREQFKNDPMISQEMLDKWQQNQTLKVNWEFDNKDLEEWGKLNDKIQETIDKPFSGQNPKSIQAELEKRIGILKKLLEQLARATGQPFDQAEFDKMSKEIKDNASNQKDNKKLEKDIQDYTNILKTGVDNVFTNLKTNIDEFGWKAESVFYSLGETVGDMLKQVANKNTAKFMEKLTEGAKDFKGLADNFSDMWKKDKGQVIGAGLGMAGSAVLSMSSPSDSVGQGLGGALTGASAGMAFGPWGAAAGAVVGGISGLLKAAKSKRQEKILLQQYEEQKKANVLLERMSALTYASQIIGQKTEYGIVSGVRRNEFGQIVSVVQGQDIIMVADRANNKKQR